MNTDKFQEVLVKSGNILIVLPKDPPFDTVAAALSLHLSLANYGKKLSVFCPSQMLVEFSQLVGVDRVGGELGNKNLTLSLKDYPADNIERVSYNIENGRMQLAIISKEGVEAPLPEQIVASYSGMSSVELVIFVGEGDDVALEEIVRVPHSALILHNYKTYLPQIGRRRHTVEIVNGGTSCYSELVGWLLIESKLPLDQDTAHNLMLGIAQATRNYTISALRPETFELVAKLMRITGKGSQPVQQQTQAPPDWLSPKVYKGDTIP